MMTAPARIKRRILSLLVIIAATAVGFYCPLEAEGKESYVYKKRVNFVKIENMPKKEVMDLAANHPYADLTVEQMHGMLLSLRLAKDHLFKKEISHQQLFLESEAAEFAPHLVAALKMAEADQWVVLSVVQKRPFFVVRNDRLTLAFLWIEGDRLYVRFKKAYAKLQGDYESTSNKNRLVEEAKGIHVSLEAGPGQRLSHRGTEEVALDTHFDYATWWRDVPKTDNGQMVAIHLEAEQKLPPVATPPVASPSVVTPPVAVPPRSTKERLTELDALKKDGLITDQEYAEMRKAILGTL